MLFVKMQIYSIIIFAVSISTIFPFIKSAKILGVFIIQSRSHHSICQPIVKGLAAKGHEITLISYFKSNQTIPNYKEIQLPEGVQDFVDSIAIEDVEKFSGLVNYIKTSMTIEKSSCDKVFNVEYVRMLINSRRKIIDLIIVEAFHTQCYHLLAYKLKIPLIIVLPPSIGMGVDYLAGNPFNPSYIPVVASRCTTKMNFLQRLKNTFHYSALYWSQNYVFNNDMETIAREIFYMKLPSDEELNSKTALVLYNNHFSIISRPKSPNAVDIAGVHIDEPKKLSKDIENFIENSDQGVIFFSFGSTIKASSISAEKLQVIKTVFSSIPQRVLWRVNELNVTEVSSNVKLGKWFPQRDILEHKNVIAFISHCGLFGIFEAIHTATPVIGIPLAFDQFQNAKILMEKEAGIYVDYFTMNENTLRDAINEIVTNSKYREKMQTLSNVFKDRPMSPLNEALYWIEYVLEHEGAAHLRIKAADMPLYQYLLLDIIVLVLSFIISVACIFKTLIRHLCY